MSQRRTHAPIGPNPEAATMFLAASFAEPATPLDRVMDLVELEPRASVAPPDPTLAPPK